MAVLLFAIAGLSAAVFGAFTDGGSAGDAGGSVAEGDVAGIEADITQGTAAQGLTEPPPRLGQYRELVELDGWINSNATNLASFGGQVRIVKFWTFGCVNCKNTLPHLRDIYSRWQPQGLEIVGVHSPEFDFERDPAAVAQATVDQNIPWPVALDTGKQNFRAWQGDRRFWPRTYVVDQAGEIRYDHIGEGRYDELEATVAFLIQNPGS